MEIFTLIALIIAAVMFAFVAVTERSPLAFGLLAWVMVPLVNVINALAN